MGTLSHRVLKITLVVMAIGLLSACGATKSFNPGEAEQSSTTTATASKALCSKNVDLGDAKFQVSAYYDSFGQYFPNKFRVKLATVPSDWKSQDYDMVVRLMAAASDGTLTQGSSLRYSFDQRTSNGYQDISPGTTYPIMNVSQEAFGIAQFLGYTGTVADFQPQSLFNAVHLVVHSADTTGAFQVLRVEFRAKVSGGTGPVVKYIDTLLPVFHADPKEYAKTHAATLQALHPLKDLAGQNFTQDQYKVFADQFCF